MNTPTPYVRPELIATRLGLPDPGLLCGLWLDQFLEQAAEADDLTADRAYDLLASLGRLERCRLELLEATGLRSAFQMQQLRLRARLEELVTRALGVVDPDGWLREAAALAQACDDGASDDQLAAWAAELLWDLDEADLVAESARSVGHRDPQLERGLAGCAAWLSEHPDRFFPAAVLVQGVGLALRSDLVAEEPDLAATADKFIVLLDALEDAESALISRIGPPPFRTQRDVETEKGWSWMPEPALAISAAVPVGSGLGRRRWRSPQGAHRAILVANRADASAVHIRINFLTGKSPATELAGQMVWLAGCPATIDAEGNADFPLSALAVARASQERCDLAVGLGRVLWHPDDLKE